MILSDKNILEEIKNKNIVIQPFLPECLGSNSYDVHLSKYLCNYLINEGEALDCKRHNTTFQYEIPDWGMILYPGILYLGSTEEYTETHKCVPFIEGKSSIGRLGINIHATAGKGDIGFCNYWTFEISVIHPVIVYPGMPIAQLIYHTAGNCDNPYNKKENAKYNEVSPLPKESMFYKNFKK